MKKITLNLFWSLFLPAGTLLIVTAILALIFLPEIVRHNAEVEAVNTYRDTLQQFLILRDYYTDNVIDKLNDGEIKVASDHVGNPHTVPLPATMIFDLSTLLKKQGINIKLYSPYPFPNRKDRVLDNFSNEAWRFLNDHPDQIYSRTEVVDGKQIMRVAAADKMNSQGCVNCHNSLPDSPKKDWKLNDVRGVLEVDSDKQIASAQHITHIILSSLVIVIILIIGILFVLFQRSVTNEIGKQLDEKNKLVDLNSELESQFQDRSHTLQETRTELENTLHQLEKYQQMLLASEKLSALGAMVAGFSHELGTPLGNAMLSISSLSDQIIKITHRFEDGKLSRSQADQFFKEAREIINLADNSIHRAVCLVTNFKQVAVDQTSEKRRLFDLATVVDETINALRPNFKNAAWKIVINIASKIVVDSYPGPLEQIINNLVLNCIRHGFDERDHGCITIHSYCEKNQVDDTDQIVLTVSDDGVGIKPEIIHKIFNQFFTTKAGKGGSGLGLTICYNIAKNILQGSISVESSLGVGTTFKLVFPRILRDQPAED